MLTKIRERAADALLRPALLRGEANFRTLSEAIACAVFISERVRLHYVNHAAQTITGYPRDELLSTTLWELVHPACRELDSHRGDARLAAQRKGTGRDGRVVAVLLLDRDKLKKINAGYGHLIGSEALCRFADVRRLDCRAIDKAARFGGDEFVGILPETTAAAARLVAS